MYPFCMYDLMHMLWPFFWKVKCDEATSPKCISFPFGHLFSPRPFLTADLNACRLTPSLMQCLVFHGTNGGSGGGRLNEPLAFCTACSDQVFLDLPLNVRLHIGPNTAIENVKMWRLFRGHFVLTVNVKLNSVGTISTILQNVKITNSKAPGWIADEIIETYCN